MIEFIAKAIVSEPASVAVREAIDWVSKSLGRSPRALADAKSLKALLKENPSELCKRLCKS